MIFKRGTEEKDVRELSTEELDNYTLIGTALGADLFHCLYLGMRHADNFFQRVYGYIVKPADPPYAITVAFYEKK